MVKVVTSRTASRWRQSVDQLTLRDLIGYYEFHNRTEGKSPKTISWYKQSLDLFERFLVRSGISRQIADIGEPEVRAFIAHLQNKVKWSENGGPGPKLSAEGIQNRVRALKAFFAWLHREGYTESNRLLHLKNFKAPRKMVEVLSEDEIDQMLSSLDQRTPWGARDYAIVMLMLDSGLRMSEVTGLKSAEVDVDAGHLKVLGKGGKERIVPFGATTQKALWRYTHHFKPEAVTTDRFFLTLDGRSMTGGGLRSLFKRLAERSGVTRLHPHLCRHTFATRYLMNGGDVFSLQQILGHSTLEMVRRYVSLASAHVAVQHRKFSPMDRLRG
jgi:integrase/recombinase XerC/integrase/recombinase XerD